MIIIKYKVTITETLSKTYEVEADTLANAEDIVTDRYYDARDGYILGADDLADVRIAAEERSKTMDIKIYQINMGRDSERVAFQSMDSLERFQGSAVIESEIYDKVFEGEVNCGNLEDVYRMFYTDRPEGYTGRSLSVSDVVEVTKSDDIEPGFYFCESIGFKKIDFDPSLAQEQEQKKTIRVVYLEPHKLAEIRDIDGSLEGLQAAVGGSIEPYYCFGGPECLVCNDEGKINGMELNRGIYDGKELVDIIAGPCFICDCSGNSFASLDEARLKKYKEQFKYPEIFYKAGNEIRSMKEKPAPVKNNDAR